MSNNTIRGIVDAENSVEWRFDLPSSNSAMGVSITNSQWCKVNDNNFVITFQYGANINVHGVREFGTCSNNASHRNNNRIDSTKAPSFTPVMPINNSLMDVQEVGLGAPTMHARIGSTWLRYPFGGPGATLYVKEAGTDGTGWNGK